MSIRSNLEERGRGKEKQRKKERKKSKNNQEPACGSGPIYCLKATQDVTLESRDSNFNNLNFLAVGKYQGYNKERILIQFDDIPTSCNKLASEKLYIKYSHSYKPSGITGTNIHRTFQVHQVSVG